MFCGPTMAEIIKQIDYNGKTETTLACYLLENATSYVEKNCGPTAKLCVVEIQSYSIND